MLLNRGLGGNGGIIALHPKGCMLGVREAITGMKCTHSVDSGGEAESISPEEGFTQAITPTGSQLLSPTLLIKEFQQWFINIS